VRFVSSTIPYRNSKLQKTPWNLNAEDVGRLLFDQIVAMDLEGIVCKQKNSPYKVTEKPSRYWIKVKNSRYSQLEGREKLFERV
jgi:ATP-dependent DNA ligase